MKICEGIPWKDDMDGEESYHFKLETSEVNDTKLIGVL